jgi:hypothetical protein
MSGQNFWTSTPIAPDSLGTACALSGRNSTYRPVQILQAGSLFGGGLRGRRVGPWVLLATRPPRRSRRRATYG